MHKNKLTLSMYPLIDRENWTPALEIITVYPHGDRPMLSFYNWLILKVPHKYRGSGNRSTAMRSKAIEFFHALIKEEHPAIKFLKAINHNGREMAIAKLNRFIIRSPFTDDETEKGIIILLGEYYTYTDKWQENHGRVGA